ncbi:hypothetical protein BC628DRAFT_127004 [Trametes gibbosa]|nr:hypothetical protein BC628DRAFT_127004 [Trametes gibbosa]
MPDRISTITLPPDLEFELRKYGDLEFDTECAVRSRMLTEYCDQMDVARRNAVRFYRNLAISALLGIAYVLGLHASAALFPLYLLRVAMLYALDKTAPPPRRDARGVTRPALHPRTTTPGTYCFHIQVLGGGIFLYYTYFAGLLPAIGVRAQTMCHKPRVPLAFLVVWWFAMSMLPGERPPLKKTVEEHVEDYCSHVRWPLSSPRLVR